MNLDRLQKFRQDYKMNKMIYRNLIDIEIDYITTWFAPFENSGKAILPKGTKIKTLSPINGEEILVVFKPIEYKKLEKIIIPELDRTDPKYNDYFLGVNFREFEKHFELITNQVKK